MFLSGSTASTLCIYWDPHRELSANALHIFIFYGFLLDCDYSKEVQEDLQVAEMEGAVTWGPYFIFDGDVFSYGDQSCIMG